MESFREEQKAAPAAAKVLGEIYTLTGLGGVVYQQMRLVIYHGEAVYSKAFADTVR